MNLIIYGNGPMAKVVFSYARHIAEIAGFTVDDHCIAEGGERFCGRPLVPFSAVEQVFNPHEHRMMIAVGFREMNALRERKYWEARQKGYDCPSYVHETVVQHADVAVEDNCMILDHVCIHPDCKIGRGTFISSNASIGHSCTLGPFNWINSGVTISGGCRTGRGCFFGVNSSMAHKIEMGTEVFVGANTLINKPAKDGEVYLSPAGELFPSKSRFFLNFRNIFE